jgi:hypothetical protein
MLAFDLSFLLGVQTRFFVHTCYLVFYLKTWFFFSQTSNLLLTFQMKPFFYGHL